jgi:hypothetical protein
MKGTIAPIVVVLVLLIGIPLAYVASYYLGCSHSEGITGGIVEPRRYIVVRRYRHQWQRMLFEPARSFESWARDCEVIIPDNFSG